MLEILQLLATLCVAALFLLAYLQGGRHIRAARAAADPNLPPTPPSMGLHARILVGFATLLIAAILAWRAFSRGNPALPLACHLDAFLVLSLLLAIALIYFRWTRHLAGLAFYILPMIFLVLLLGVLLEIVRPGPFPYYEKAWTILHLAAIIAGSLCFALACVGGIVYLAAAKQLKTKKMGAARSSRFPPLASLEKFNRRMVYVGFPLLTIGILTGALSIIHGGAHQPIPKLALAATAWIIYALLLPLAPSFRGQRAAWLSIIGFIFILAGYVTSM